METTLLALLFAGEDRGIGDNTWLIASIDLPLAWRPIIVAPSVSVLTVSPRSQ
jgi:hypothetical protein